jgi:hypothetical protein
MKFPRRVGISHIPLFFSLAFLFYFLFTFGGMGRIDNDDDLISSPNVNSWRPHVQLVISHFGDSLDWLNDVSNILDIQDREDIVCYCKQEGVIPNNCKNIVRRPNIGRVDETYLHHIVQNYDNLPDFTVFLPDTAFQAHKASFTNRLLRLYRKKKTTILLGHEHDRPLGSFLHKFVVNHYAGFEKNQSSGSIVLCDLRPFGKWYKHFFQSTKDHIRLVSYYTMFVVSKDDIRNTPKKTYSEMLTKYMQNGDSLECGHFMERSWSSLFDPSPSSLFSFVYPRAITDYVNQDQYALKV